MNDILHITRFKNFNINLNLMKTSLGFLKSRIIKSEFTLSTILQKITYISFITDSINFRTINYLHGYSFSILKSRMLIKHLLHIIWICSFFENQPNIKTLFGRMILNILNLNNYIVLNQIFNSVLNRVIEYSIWSRTNC